MKGIHDLLKKLLNAGVTDEQLEILAHSKEPFKVVVEQIKLASRHYEEAGKMTKRHGRLASPARIARTPSTVRGVDAPVQPLDKSSAESSVVLPDNPVIKTSPEPVEPPPVTMHASGVKQEMDKLNGQVDRQLVEDPAPPTRVDIGRMRKRNRLATPTSPVESSSDDSEQATSTDQVPPTVDPIAPLLGALGQKTVQNISQKRQKKQTVEQTIRKSVVAK